MKYKKVLQRNYWGLRYSTKSLYFISNVPWHSTGRRYKISYIFNIKKRSKMSAVLFLCHLKFFLIFLMRCIADCVFMHHLLLFINNTICFAIKFIICKPSINQSTSKKKEILCLTYMYVDNYLMIGQSDFNAVSKKS